MINEIKNILEDKHLVKILLDIQRYCIENDIEMNILLKKWITDSFNIEKYGKKPFDREKVINEDNKNINEHNKAINEDNKNKINDNIIENNKNIKERKKKIRVINVE